MGKPARKMTRYSELRRSGVTSQKAKIGSLGFSVRLCETAFSAECINGKEQALEYVAVEAIWAAPLASDRYVAGHWHLEVI